MSAVHRGSMGRKDGEKNRWGNTRRPLHRVVERAPVPRTPSRIRTGAAAVRGRCPRPLNDGGMLWSCEPADLIGLLDPYPQPDSNRRRRRERAVS